MAKLTIAAISSGYASVAALNAAFDAIEAALENTLSRDGTSPNTMSANLDMNSNRIVNLPDGSNASEPATVRQLQAASVTTVVPSQTGHANKVLKTDGTVIAWSTIAPLLGAELSAAADRLPYFSGASALSLATLTSFARTLLDDADAATMLTTLGVSSFVQTLLNDADAATARGTLDASRATNSQTEKLVPVKTADYVNGYSAAESAERKFKLEELPLPRSYLAGGALSNNGTDAVNDIDIAAGEARDSTNAVNIRWGALTKQLDVAWAAGTNQGGRSADALADGTWHVYAIRKDSDGTGDIILDTSAAGPNLPAGYTYFRRIGSIVRAAAAIRAFLQTGDWFLYKTPVNDLNNVAVTTANRTNRTISVPSGIKVLAKLWAVVRAGAADSSTCLYISDPDLTDVAAGPAAAGSVAGSDQTSTADHGNEVLCFTNTSAQVGTRSDSAGNHYLTTLGWIDRRGRDD